MPKVNQAHLDQRRQLILDAAGACFAREGFQRTTMRDIIQQAGVSAGGIYGYFGSKEDIIAAIAAGRHAREAELIDAAARVEIGQGIDMLLKAFLGSLGDPAERGGRRLGIQLWAEALRSPASMAMVREGLDAPRLKLARLIEGAQARGELSAALDPYAASRAVIALFHGLVLQLAWDDTLEVEPLLPIMEAAVRAVLGLA